MEFLLDIGKRYGLPFLLLCIAVYWQNSRLDRIETRLANCEADKFKIITDNNDRSNEVIRKNTIALDKNTEVMETLLGFPKSKKKAITPLSPREGVDNNLIY